MFEDYSQPPPKAPYQLQDYAVVLQSLQIMAMLFNQRDHTLMLAKLAK